MQHNMAKKIIFVLFIKDISNFINIETNEKK